MPRLRSSLLALAIAVLSVVVLAACGESSGGSPSTTTSGSASASPLATAAGPVPEVTGDFGKKPTITIPKDAPADALVAKTLIEGAGPRVASGDLLVADYVGMTWSGKEFDSSFSRGVPAAFPIGVGQVIQGWDAALVGQTVGNRVVLSIPPSLGYGEAGKPDAGISGDDTLVFVVDIVGTYHSGATPHGQATPTDEHRPDLPQVTGDRGAEPKVRVPAGLKPPGKVRSVVLATGDGPTVAAGSLAIVNYAAVGWNNEWLGSTWAQQRPQGVPVGLPASPSPFDRLVGLPAGSRVMLVVPPPSGQGDPTTDTAVAVIDIVDVIPPST